MVAFLLLTYSKGEHRSRNKCKVQLAFTVDRRCRCALCVCTLTFCLSLEVGVGREALLLVMSFYMQICWWEEFGTSHFA